MHRECPHSVVLSEIYFSSPTEVKVRRQALEMIHIKCNRKVYYVSGHEYFQMSFFGGGSGGNVDKSKYEHLTLSIRQTVLERARYRCHGCSKKFGPSNHPHFEHINGSLKDNRPTNLRPLCSECFKAVEKKETKKSGFLGGMRNTIGGMFQK